MIIPAFVSIFPAIWVKPTRPGLEHNRSSIKRPILSRIYKFISKSIEFFLGCQMDLNPSVLHENLELIFPITRLILVGIVIKIYLMILIIQKISISFSLFPLFLLLKDLLLGFLLFVINGKIIVVIDIIKIILIIFKGRRNFFFLFLYFFSFF